MKNNINKELNYIKYLTGYKRGLVISEQAKPTTTAAKPTTTAAKPTTTAAKPTTSSGKGTNKFLEPIVSVKEKYDSTTKQAISWEVEGFSYFPTSKVASDYGAKFIKAIKDKIFENPKLSGDSIAITYAFVRGGASNYYETEITPDVYFDGENYANALSTGKKGSGTYYKANKGYATDRATKFWDYVKLNMPTTAGGGSVRVSKSAKATTIGYVVRTGGVSDTSSQRDWNTYPVPGQHVYIKLFVEVRPPEPNKSLSAGCLFNAKIKFAFEEAKGVKHSCDMAQFTIYANGIELGNVDLGNGSLLTKGKIAYKTEGKNGATASRKQPKTVGADVSGTLVVATEALAKKIIDASANGEVFIQAKGVSHQTYTTRGFNCLSGCSTHSEVPWINVLNNKSQTVFDGRPSTAEELVRCGGNVSQTTPCPLWSLGEFNPCAVNVKDGTLSKVMKKG